jgi:hypothetical protein
VGEKKEGEGVKARECVRLKSKGRVEWEWFVRGRKRGLSLKKDKIFLNIRISFLNKKSTDKC